MAEATKPEETKNRARKGRSKPDLATLGGMVVALGGLLGGLLVEGGKIRDVSQFTAAMIVLGGTAGAVMVSTPLTTLIAAMKRMASIFFDSTLQLDGLITEVIGYATKARKNGLVSLEQEAMLIEDPFLNKALNLAVDGTDLQEIRSMLEL